MHKKANTRIEHFRGAPCVSGGGYGACSSAVALVVEDPPSERAGCLTHSQSSGQLRAASTSITHAPAAAHDLNSAVLAEERVEIDRSAPTLLAMCGSEAAKDSIGE